MRSRLYRCNGPDGADMIALQEDATEDGDCVIVREAGRAGQHIRRAGLDFSVGDLCVARGRAFTARDLGLLRRVDTRTSLCAGARASRSSRPGRAGGAGSADRSRSDCRVERRCSRGCRSDLGRGRDRSWNRRGRIDAIAQAVDRAAGADLLVTTGGASVGDHDLVRHGAASRGFVTDFWRIAMRRASH